MAIPFKYRAIKPPVPLYFNPNSIQGQFQADLTSVNIYRFPSGYFAKRKYPRKYEIKIFDENYKPLKEIPSSST